MLPIATDTSVHRTPLVNYGLIAANVFVYMFEHTLTKGGRGSPGLVDFFHALMLDGQEPRLFQFFTYQFMHANLMHLGGNMLFLWVFGNAVNAKMGNLPYLFFYLAGGVFAAIGYLIGNDAGLMGASGAIAAVTTAYLALFPRSHVTILYFWILIGTFELPSMILIVFKIILWDNVLAPQMSEAVQVAFDAHLAGYAFGFGSVSLLLSARLLPRDQFDIIALIRRWAQRQSLRAAVADAEPQARGPYNRVARPVSLDDVTVRLGETTAADPISEMRTQISDALDRGDRETAAATYEKLLQADSRQVLGRAQQLDVANEFYNRGRFPQAAVAYEKFLANYPSSPEGPHLKLLLGIIYARDLQQYEVAQAHLRQALERITDERRREQALHWLSIADEAMGKPPT
jgi:membrane associated rhomboid family serine protease